MQNILLENYLGKCNREDLIKWLMSNDPNGCYSDEQSKGEGFEPMTRNQALELALNQLNEG
jgi:hypothetical protein